MRRLQYALRVGGVALVAVLAARAAGAHHARAGGRAARAGEAVASVTVAGVQRRLPPSFFGLSVEYPELPLYERFPPAFERILGLLKVAGDGPQWVRIGGDSADVTFWRPGSRALPPQAFVLTDAWFTQTSELIAQAGLKVILDLNLRNADAHAAAAMAGAALARFPARSVSGLQVGNEPDQYRNGYSPRRYVAAFKAYFAALRQVAPRLPVLGPAVTSTSGNFGWIRTLARSARRQVGALDGHRYPLGACAAPGQPDYPTVPKLLSDSLTRGLAGSVLPAVQLAHRMGRTFRLDEVNSVTCGGVAGVSDTFATALWAPDGLLSLLKTGLDAVNFHIRPTKINGPLVVGAGGFVARPLFYGLALFTRTLSPDGQLLRVGESGAGAARLRAWAVRVHGGILHVLLINKGAAPVRARVALRRRGAATVERMQAPSPTATGGVTLAGQHLGADGTWQGTRVRETVAAGPAGYAVSVPSYSAALVSVPAR